MRVLLDTHAFLWWTGRLPGLSRRQEAVLRESVADGGRIGLAAISLWEMALLSARGRIAADAHAMRQALAHPELEVVPLTLDVALESQKLGRRFPSDPADCLIAATARVHGVPLVTADGAIRRSRAVDVI